SRGQRGRGPPSYRQGARRSVRRGRGREPLLEAGVGLTDGHAALGPARAGGRRALSRREAAPAPARRLHRRAVLPRARRGRLRLRSLLARPDRRGDVRTLPRQRRASRRRIARAHDAGLARDLRALPGVARRLLADVGVLHVAAIRLVLTDEERLERSHDLPVERALLVGLHVSGVVPQAHRESRILVRLVLGQPAAAQPLEALAFGEDGLPVGAFEVFLCASPELAPRNADHYG